MTRALILLGITALACRDKEAPKPATPGSAAAVTPAQTAPKPRADKAPELPVFGEAPPNMSIQDRFKNEDVDPVFKSRTEADLKKRLAKHPPSETECKASVCRLTITGSEAELEASLEDLQTLHDAAQSLVLTRPDPTKIVAYLTYERAD